AITAGANVKTVQQQLGHASATLTLDRYGHLYGDELEALSSALESLRIRRRDDSSLTVPTTAAVIRISDHA
ncbi:MAG: hypothetical protein ACXWFU_08265, partial [Actinomycetota bacterium]